MVAVAGAHQPSGQGDEHPLTLKIVKFPPGTHCKLHWPLLHQHSDISKGLGCELCTVLAQILQTINSRRGWVSHIQGTFEWTLIVP